MQISLTAHGDWGLSWVAAEPAQMRRGSHALADDGRVWLVDPVAGEGLADRIAALGEVRGVIQLVDRHPRDCAALAARYGVPHHLLPRDGVPGAPFTPLVLADRRWWREVALWWPEHRALMVAESVGTAPYYLAPGQRLGLHPLMRLTPPRELGAYDPEHLLPGHGAAVSGAAVAGDLRRAIAHSRRDIPGVLGVMVRGRRAA
jgi:hypothetical protein